MSDLLKLHKVQGGNGTNLTTYVENSDEHFNLGELNNVVSENGSLTLTKKPSTSFYLDGTDFIDKSPNKLAITKGGSVSIANVEGEGSVMSFNGSSLGYVDIPNGKLLLNQTYTIETRIRIKGTTSSSQVLLHQGTSSNDIRLGIDTDITRLFLQWWNGNSTAQGGYLTLKHPLGINTWYDLKIVFNINTKTVKLYVNEELQSTLSFTNLPTAKSGVLRLGANVSSGGYSNYDMKYFKFYTEDLDEVNIPEEGYRISPPIKLPKDIISSKINWEGEGRISLYKRTKVPNPNVGKDSLYFYSFKEKHSNVAGTWELYEDKERGLVYKSSGSSNALNLRLMPTSYDVTVSFGFYVPSGVATTKRYIFLNENGSSNRGVIWENGQIKYQYATGGVYKYSSGVTIPYDTWVDVVLHFTSSNIIIFIDGEQKLKEASCPISYGTNDKIDLASGMMLTNLAIFNKLVDAKDLRYFSVDEVLNIPLQKGESINSLPHNFHLKQEVKGEETISNVKLELKYKPKKEYIRPSDFIEGTPKELVVYNAGDECEKITGGWKGHQWDSSFPSGYYSKKDTYLEYGDNTSNYGDGGFVTTNGIDLTPYSILWVDSEFVSYNAPGYNAEGRICICQDGSPNWRNKTFDVVHSRVNRTGRFQVEIDISNYNGVFYLGVEGGSGAYNHHTNIQRLHSMKLLK